MRRVGFFLPLYKPFGMTSNRAVQIVKRALKRRSDEFGAKLKVGHAGTLDPRATGVLTIAVGRATRFIRFLRTEKHYTATFRLGVETDSDDLEGVVLREDAAPWVTEEDVRSALRQFVGTLSQVPPIFSAIRLDGARAYTLARGKRGSDGDGQKTESGTVKTRDALLEKLGPRSINVSRIDVLAWRPGPFPEVDVAIECSRGTYIRSIARDLGRVLGRPVESGGGHVGCTMAALERTRCGAFTLLPPAEEESSSEDSHPHPPLNWPIPTVDDDEIERALDNRRAMSSIDDAMAHFDKVFLPPGVAHDLKRGDSVKWNAAWTAATKTKGADDDEEQQTTVRVVNTADGKCSAVACVRSIAGTENRRIDTLVRA